MHHTKPVTAGGNHTGETRKEGVDPMVQFLEITVLCKITTTNQRSWPVDDDDKYIAAGMAVLLFEKYRYVIQET